MTSLSMYLLAAIALTVAPGPDNLQVMARGMQQGFIAALVAALGFASGLVFHTFLVSSGLAALIVASPLLFAALKYVGAAYLIWMGYLVLVSDGGNGRSEVQDQGLWKIYRQCIIGNIFNPKVSLFFLTFLPQFVDVSKPVLPQFLLLSLVFIAQTLIIFSAYGLIAAYSGRRVGAMAGGRRWVKVLTGLLFVGLGIRAACL